MKATSEITRVFIGVGLALLSVFALVGHVAAQICVEPHAGLVSWWPADGNANDIQGANDGTLLDGATFAPGMVGQAFSFNGTSRVSAPTTDLPIGNSNRTLDLWVKVNNFVAGEAFFAGYGRFGSYDQTYHLGTTGDILFFSQWGHAVLGPALQTGKWYHIAVTNVGNSVTLYVDGAAIASGNLSINTPSGTQLFVGSLPGDTYRRLDGLVDEVEVYDRALSSTEIQAIFIAGSTGKCKVTCSEGHSAISGLLWVDNNGDGSHAPDEPVIPDHRVCAQPMGHRDPSCAVSDSQGSYRVCVLPGTYLVAPDSTAPGGRAGQWDFRLPVVVRPGSTPERVDLGFVPAGLVVPPAWNCAVDLNFDQDGILPSSQSLDYVGNVPEASVFSVSQGMLHLDTLTRGGSVFAGYQLLNAYDPGKDFSLEFRMKVFPGTGMYGVGFEVSDTVSDFELGFSDSSITLPPPRRVVPFTSSDGFHMYRLTSPGGTSFYQLFIDGKLFVSGSITAEGDPGQRFLFGDDTYGRIGNGRADIDYVRYCQSH